MRTDFFGARNGMQAIAMRVAVLVVLTAATARAAETEPATGVPFQVRHGWYAETQLGVFTAFGGYKAFSNAAPFIGVSAGLDIEAVPNLSVFFAAAHTANVGSCHALDSKGECQTWKLGDGSTAGAPDSFAVIPVEVGARYGFGDVLPRLQPHVTAALGYTILRPAIAQGAPGGSVHAGLGGGIEYVTRLDGLTIGAEVLVRAAFSPLLAGLSAYPRIKYVF